MAGKATETREAARVLAQGLKAMFRSLENRPAPERLKRLIDGLDGASPPAPGTRTG